MGHWYRLDNGEPMYEVLKSKGEGTRPTTLADARKLKLVPSVTGIIGILDKPMLTKWKMEQILKAIYENPFEYGDKLWDKYKALIYAVSEKETKEAAELGSKIHDALEQFYTNGKILDLEFHKYCIPVIELISDRFGHTANWNAEHSFSHPLGFGGKCDLHLLPCYEYPNGIILDFKTKSTDNFKGVKAYFEQCMQLVAYREGLGMPRAECYNLFISTKEPGKLKLHKWEEEDCRRAWLGFKNLVEFWKIVNKFD